MIYVLEGRKDIGDWSIAEYLNCFFPVDEGYGLNDFDPWTSFLEYAEYHRTFVQGEEINVYQFIDGSCVYYTQEDWYAPEGQL